MDAATAKLDAIVKITAYSVSPALFFNDKESIDEAFKGLESNDEIDYVVVTDLHDNIISSVNLNFADSCKYKDQNIKSFSIENDSILKQGTTIIFKEKKIGTLYMGHSLDEMKTGVRKMESSIAMVSLIIFIIGLILVNTLVLFLTRPLSKITVTIKEIAEGDLSKRVEVYSNDEIGKLSLSFNKMVTQLEQAYKKLHEEIQYRKNVEIELVKSQENILKALETEKEFNELKSRFISMVSHEYRTPLTIIFSTTYLLEQFYKYNHTDDFNKHIGRIRTAVDNMTVLLENVVKFGSLDSMFSQNDIRSLNTLQLIKDLIVHHNTLNEKHITIQFDHNVNDCTIEIDYNMFNYIFNSLVNNAIKYSFENSTVKVNLICLQDSVKIEIIDSGIGIPPDDMNHLFDPFFRASNVSGISGTGLGLATVKKGVESVGGNISVESELNKGAKFTVSFRKKILNG